MPHGTVGNYLRTHRKKSGLSQHEVAIIIGYKQCGPVSHHERSHYLPPLHIALAYEVAFRVPVSELFRGIRETVEQGTENELEKLEHKLQDTSGKGRQANATAKKLQWIAERRALSDV